MCLCVSFIVNFWIFSGNDAQKTLICNREEKLLLGIKIAVAIVGFMIFIVILIRKLRECDSSSGSSVSEGGGVINSQVSIQLSALNTDDGSVIASAAWYLLPT